MLQPHLLAMMAAIVFAAAALLIKRASDLGVGAMSTMFVSNLVAAVLFQSLTLFGGSVHLELWWQPVLAGVVYIAGQWLTFYSFEKGDVSLATPVMGIKIVLVAVFVTMLGGQRLDPRLWAAAVLATLGIVLLNSRTPKEHHHVGMTIFTASMAAAAFALFDVMVQTWAPVWGLGRFLPCTIGAAGVASLLFFPKVKQPLAQLSRQAWAWLFAGALGIAVQAMLIAVTIAHWGQAASANVIYSSRGLWSVILVWIFGHWLSSRERDLGARVLAWRLAGGSLMMVAIVLVVL